MCQTVVIKSKDIEIKSAKELSKFYPTIDFVGDRNFRGFCLGDRFCQISLTKTFQMNNIKFEQKGNKFIIE